MTVLDFITKVMLQLGCINQGDTPNASEAAQIFDATNMRLNLWSADSLFIYAVTEYQMSLTAGVQSYAAGAGALNINASRPLLRHGRVQIGGSTVWLPLELIGQSEWNAIEEPTLTGQRVQKAFPDYAWPVMTIKVWPIPSVNCSTIFDAWSKLVQFATVTDPMDLPDGYLFTLLFQVCLDVYPSFASQVPPTNLQIIMQNAAIAQQTLRALNADLLRGRAAGPVPESPSLSIQPMPNVQASPANPPQ